MFMSPHVILYSFSGLKLRKDGKQKATWDTCSPSCFPGESNAHCYLKFCGWLKTHISTHKIIQRKLEMWRKSAKTNGKKSNTANPCFLLILWDYTRLVCRSSSVAKMLSKNQYCVKDTVFLQNVNISVMHCRMHLKSGRGLTKDGIKYSFQMCSLCCIVICPFVGTRKEISFTFFLFSYCPVFK